MHPVIGKNHLEMHTGHGRCRLVDVHTPWLMRAILGWCCLSLVDVSWRMHDDNDRCRRIDNHTPRLMHASIGYCFYQLVGVA